MGGFCPAPLFSCTYLPPRHLLEPHHSHHAYAPAPHHASNSQPPSIAALYYSLPYLSAYMILPVSHAAILGKRKTGRRKDLCPTTSILIQCEHLGRLLPAAGKGGGRKSCWAGGTRQWEATVKPHLQRGLSCRTTHLTSVYNLSWCFLPATTPVTPVYLLSTSPAMPQPPCNPPLCL